MHNVTRTTNIQITISSGVTLSEISFVSFLAYSFRRKHTPSKQKWDKERIFLCDSPLLVADLPDNFKGLSDYVTSTDGLFSFISHFGTRNPKFTFLCGSLVVLFMYLTVRTKWNVPQNPSNCTPLMPRVSSTLPAKNGLRFSGHLYLVWSKNKMWKDFILNVTHQGLLRVLKELFGRQRRTNECGKQFSLLSFVIFVWK